MTRWVLHRSENADAFLFQALHAEALQLGGRRRAGQDPRPVVRDRDGVLEMGARAAVGVD